MRNQCWWRRERFEGGVGWVCEPGGGGVWERSMRVSGEGGDTRD